MVMVVYSFCIGRWRGIMKWSDCVLHAPDYIFRTSHVGTADMAASTVSEVLSTKFSLLPMLCFHSSADVVVLRGLRSVVNVLPFSRQRIDN